MKVRPKPKESECKARMLLPTTVAPLSMEDTFQDSQWMLEAVNSPQPYIYTIFSYTYTPMMKFNL